MDVDYVADLTAAVTGAAGDITDLLAVVAVPIIGVTVAFLGFRVVRRLIAGAGK